MPCLFGLDLTEVPYFHFYYRSIFVRLAGMANKRERERERISLSHVWRALTHRAAPESLTAPCEAGAKPPTSREPPALPRGGLKRALAVG